MFVQTETSIPVRYTNLYIFIFLRTFWPHFFFSAAITFL